MSAICFDVLIQIRRQLVSTLPNGPAHTEISETATRAVFDLRTHSATHRFATPLCQEWEETLFHVGEAGG